LLERAQTLLELFDRQEVVVEDDLVGLVLEAEATEPQTVPLPSLPISGETVDLLRLV
jgi:hypothetical protein